MGQNDFIRKETRGRITTGTREWADYNVNCIRGCYNNCRYCYAKIMAKRFGRTEYNNWHNMKINNNVLNRNFKKKSGRIMFPSTHDIIDISPYKEVCFIILKKLLESGNNLLITTKPRIRIIKEITEIYGKRFKDQIQFRFTITSFDDDLLKFWEPNAPRFEERLTSLKYAFENDFKTSVSIEPFLDDDPAKLVEYVSPFTTESIWIGRMNYIAKQSLDEDEKIFYNRVRKNYETSHLQQICKKLHNHPKIRFKDSIQIQLQSH
jgi:DNA repair photolyase